jgi:hypothetical protein
MAKFLLNIFWNHKVISSFLDQTSNFATNLLNKVSNHMVYDRKYAMYSKLYDINIIYCSTNQNTSFDSCQLT